MHAVKTTASQEVIMCIRGITRWLDKQPQKFTISPRNHVLIPSPLFPRACQSPSQATLKSVFIGLIKPNGENSIVTFY